MAVKGYLKLLILNLISKSNKSGYQLMKVIELHLGKKPSPGSVYPILNDLYDNGFVLMKKLGKKKMDT